MSGKYTRTAYAQPGSRNGQLAIEIANHAGLYPLDEDYTDLLARSAKGRRKVRITIIVETIDTKKARP